MRRPYSTVFREDVSSRLLGPSPSDIQALSAKLGVPPLRRWRRVAMLRL
jgi:hypothetical protein